MVKKLFKYTHVGRLPEDWDCLQAIEVIDEISMGPFGSDITVSNFVSSGVPVLNGYNVSQIMPASTPKEQEAVAETIENNIGKEIVERTQSNPKYYEKMSALLRELIEKRKNDVINYEEYLRQIVELARKVHKPESGTEYPPGIRYMTPSCPANRTISGEAKSKSVKSGVLFVLS